MRKYLFREWLLLFISTILFCIFGFFITSCSTVPNVQNQYKPIKVEIPEPPTLPIILTSDLECLSPKTLSDLTERDKKVRLYALELKLKLEAIAQ